MKSPSKDDRRRLMPYTTAIVDAYREAFGELEAIKATEAGIAVEWRKS